MFYHLRWSAYISNLNLLRVVTCKSNTFFFYFLTYRSIRFWCHDKTSRCIVLIKIFVLKKTVNWFAVHTQYMWLLVYVYCLTIIMLIIRLKTSIRNKRGFSPLRHERRFPIRRIHINDECIATFLFTTTFGQKSDFFHTFGESSRETIRRHVAEKPTGLHDTLKGRPISAVSQSDIGNGNMTYKSIIAYGFSVIVARSTGVLVFDPID